MDFALKLTQSNIRFATNLVSILVLMDFALKQSLLVQTCHMQRYSFNPCFDGFCSKTQQYFPIELSSSWFQSLF